MNTGVGFGTLFEKKIQDVVGRAVAEKLSKCLLMVGDGVFLDEGEEILRGVPGKR